MPKKPDVHDFVLRERVQAHPATDTWMRGDRYGEVVKLTPTAVHVKMDRSKRTIRFHPKNIEHLQSNPRKHIRVTPLRKNPFCPRNPTGLRAPRKQPKRWIISAAVEGKRLVMYLAVGGHAFTDKLSDARIYYSKSEAVKDARRVHHQLPLNVKWVRVDKY